jgi:hypothetical protein
MRTYHWFSTCLIVLFGAVLSYWPQAPVCHADSVAFESRSVRGAYVSLITVNLNDATVKVDVGLAERGIAHAESFGRLISRHTPLAAVTGTYFDIRTYIPTGSIVSGGKLVYESHIGTAVCFTPDNKVRFIPAKLGQACDLSGSQCAVRTGPRLLADGEYALNPRAEGFRHPGLYGARTRMVLGVTDKNKLLLVFVRTPVTFGRAAGIMRALGAVNAVCLDGGTSSAMYYKGHVIRRPGRLLTNLIEVRRRPIDELPAQLVASAGGRVSGLVFRVSRDRVDDRIALSRERETPEAELDELDEQVALLGEPIRLRPSKGGHSLFPVDRTKLAGLKSLNHS